MDKITHDTELMTQYVAAQGISTTSRLIALHDENNEPMILTLGTLWKDKSAKLNRFYLLKKDAKGLYQKLDLGLQLGLEKTYDGEAIAAIQEPSSNKIYLAMGVTKGSDQGRIILLEPLSARDLVSSSLPKRIIPSSSSGTLSPVVGIYMSTASKESYPLVIVTYKELGHQLLSKDVRALSVTSSSGKWTWKSDNKLALPENASEIHALQPLAIDWIEGRTPAVAFLYTTAGTTVLNITTFDKEQDPFFLTCLAGSRTLAGISAEEGDGYTDLLVGGPDLFYFEHSTLTKKNGNGKRLSTTPFDCTGQIHVAQSGKDVTIWAVSSKKGISFLNPSSLMNNTTTPVQLIPDGQGGLFTAFKPAANEPEIFIYHAGAQEVAILELDPVSRLWNTVPLMIQTMDQIVEVQSHVTHVSVTGVNEKPLADHSLHLKSTNRTSVLVNGTALLSGPDGVAVTTDSRGCLSITTPTDSLCSEPFELIDLSNSVSQSIDTNIKAKNALVRISTSEGLQNEKLQNGTKLLHGKNLSPQETERVADAIKTMLHVIDPKKYEPGKEHVATYYDLYSWIDDAKQLWNDGVEWLKRTAHKVEDWIIRKVEQGYEFFLRIGGQAYKWVVKTAKEAWEGIKMVVNKILDVAKTIIEWIGYLFEWGDINDTHKSLVHLANSALDCVPTYIDKMKSKSDSFFTNIEKELAQWGQLDLPSNVKQSSANTSNLPSSTSRSDALSSSKVNWAVNLFHHGGAEGTTIPGNEAHNSDGFTNFWDIQMAKVAKEWQPLIQTMGNTFLRLFNSKSWGNIEDVLKELTAKILTDFVKSIKDLLDGFLDILSAVVKEFKFLLNKEISIPVISSLYEKIFGSKLTVLDGLTFLIAIPTAILHKIIFNKAPADIKHINYSTIVAGQLGSSDVLPFNRLASTTHVFSGIFVGILNGLDIVTSPVYYDLTPTDPGTQPFGALTEHYAQKYEMYSLDDIKKEFKGPIRNIKNTFSIISCAACIPIGESKHMDLQWTSFALACAKSGISISMRYLDEGSKTEAIFGVVEGVIGTVNYGVIITIKHYEFGDKDIKHGYTIMDVISATCSEVGLITDDVARFIKDEETKAILSVVSIGCDVISGVVTGLKTATHAATGDYNNLIPWL